MSKYHTEERVIETLPVKDIFDTHKLLVKIYNTHDDINDKAKTGWKYSSGAVYTNAAWAELQKPAEEQTRWKTKPAFNVLRNYGSFWNNAYEALDGKRYLLCGEKYMGLTILNLTDGDRIDYFPNCGQCGTGWCHYDIGEQSPSKRYLTAHGCVWGGGSEIKVYDFGDPMRVPWPVVLHEMDYEAYNCDRQWPNKMGWKEDAQGEYFEYKVELDKWIGETPEDDATDEELDDIKNWEEAVETKIFRPQSK